MDKKIFPSVPRGGSHSIVLPPRLVKAKQGWFFVFYVPQTAGGDPERDRKSYNLNRIRDKRRRREQAEKIAEILEEFLPLGYPWVGQEREYEFEKFSRLVAKKGETVETIKERTVQEAIKFVLEMKVRGAKLDTVRTYNNRAKLFLEFLSKKNWLDLPLSKFSQSHAQEYLDEVRLRVSNTTYENYRAQTLALFSPMVAREWIEKNPFKKTERLKKQKKRRRAFSPEEATPALRWAYENDWWLFVLMLLHLGGWIRRTECYRLRFRDFNLKEGYIFMAAENSKSGKESVITIPEEIRFFLLDERFSQNNMNYLVFGQNCQPHPHKSAGENTWKDKHRKMLKNLLKSSEITDIEGLSLYSWKDTGIKLLAKQLAPIELRDHARHGNLEMTMRYYQAPKISPAVQSAEFGLLDELLAKQASKSAK